MMHPTQATSHVMAGWARRTAGGLAAAILCALVLCACGSTAKLTQGLSSLGNNGGLEVKSEPSGAMLHVDNRFLGRTPKRVLLDRGKHFIVLKKDGYKDAEVWRDVKTGSHQLLEVKLEAE